MKLPMDTKYLSRAKSLSALANALEATSLNEDGSCLAASSAPINILGKPRPGCESRRLGRQKNEKPARQTAQRTSARQLYCGAAILRPRSYPSRLEKVGPPTPLEETSASAASSADMTTHLVMGGCGVVGLAHRSSSHSSSPTNQSEFFCSSVAL